MGARHADPRRKKAFPANAQASAPLAGCSAEANASDAALLYEV
jgi:hypothetical protein